MGPGETEAGRRRPMQECARGLSAAMGDNDSVLLGPSEGHVDGTHVSIAQSAGRGSTAPPTALSNQ